ncbi:MAG: hypothetical protein OXC25_13940 [Thiotrichales bacterium]|nr:hypothetical protein [Thiotrichales bacterium]
MSSTSSATEITITPRGRAGRRALLAAAFAGAILFVPGRALLAHTPYRQWQVYRRRHLMIGASREDAPSYPKAKEIQAFLETHLPEASARVARARTLRRLADLLATDQIRILLISVEHAAALGRGEPPFHRPVEIRTLWRFGDHAMIVRPSFPAAHAWILAQTFEAHGAGLPGASPAPAHAEVPLHEGVRIARDGDPMPPPPAGTLDDSHDGTDHD